MKKCDRCHRPATVHMTEISEGKAMELHLCDQCAAAAGYVQQAHIPVNEILNQLLQAKSRSGEAEALRCPECGMSWREFKDTGLLGCAKDYEVFAAQLQGVIESTQQGATHHTGKPKGGRAEASSAVALRQTELNRLRKELSRAVQKECYEEAAKLRDQIKAMENAPEPSVGPGPQPTGAA